ncbi:hypothetical protein PIB30_005766 [Stylosanthes scabra]|uniref:UVR domain-containing protein n=1 Tax=Stylosanthes scabra TaxID=79078 RepID=A0ABU6W423_9FABA|nr:hypothetical protein [Stylosanthes scabra]
MALHGTTFINGLSSTTIKEFNFVPGSFINKFQKLHCASLPSSNIVRLVLGKSLRRRDQLCLLPAAQWPNLQKQGHRKQQRVKSEDSESILSSENIALDEQTLEEELRNAIAEENYAKAAKIRDTLKNLQKDSKTTIFGINSRFYESFRNGDLATMQALWSKKDEACCVHPGLKGISGYDDVIESWNLVWANYEFPLEIRLEDIKLNISLMYYCKFEIQFDVVDYIIIMLITYHE